MHKKIKILLAGLLICFMFLLNTSSVFASDTLQPYTGKNYGKSGMTYYLITASHDRYVYNDTSYMIFYSDKPIKFSPASGSYPANIIFDNTSKHHDVLVTYNHVNKSYYGLTIHDFNDFPNPNCYDFIDSANFDVKSTDGTILFRAPWATVDAFLPVGARVMELVPTIVGLMVFCLALVICLVVLVKHLRKSARV